MNIIELQDYKILLGEDIWTELAYLLEQRQYSRVLLLVDENTGRDCLPLFRANINLTAHVIEIPAGEQHKNIKTCQGIWQAMMDYETDRRSLLINLGGGVVGDMGGFCAATFKRGIDFIQFPTTLLAQVDASIGGKLGIDFNGIKNSVGLFSNPEAVFIYPPFLDTLPYRELRSGFAEIIKHALILDEKYWQTIQKADRLSPHGLTHLIQSSLHIKQHVVEEDPFEKNLRKVLNFGHTIGHAVESYALQTDTPLLHGEAIAVGMICEAWLSHKTFVLKQSELKAITDFILKIYGKPQLNPKSFEQLIALMRQDKKNEDAKINFTLLKSIGNAIVNQTCGADSILDSLAYYQGLEG